MGLSDILAMLMHHAGNGEPPMMFPGSQPMAPNMPSGAPPAHMNTPDLGRVASQMPQMANRQSPFASLGSALQSSAGPGSGLRLTDANYGLSPQGGGLHALLQQILGQ